MKITECVHLQYWVFVSISSLEGCIIISYRACLVSLNPGFDMSNKASHLPNCSVSSLAWFMSNQETSFVTIGQRVLARPLKYVLRFLDELNYSTDSPIFPYQCINFWQKHLL